MKNTMWGDGVEVKEPREEMIVSIQVRGADGWTRAVDSNAAGETSLESRFSCATCD